MLGCVVDGNVHEHREWNEEEPTNDGSKVDEKRDAGLHEPPDGKHRRCEGDTDVGVGEGVPRGVLRPVGLFQRNAALGARRLVDFTVGIKRCQSNVAHVKGLSDVVKERNLSVTQPDKWILHEEQANHGEDRPNPDRFERISCMLNGARADVGGDVQHLQRGFKTGQGKRVLNQPHASENDEVHDTEEPGKHGSDDANEGQRERFTVIERYQRTIGQGVRRLTRKEKDGREGEDEPRGGVRGTRRCGRGDVHLRRRPLQCHAKKISDVPGR